MWELVASMEGCYSTAMLRRLKLVGYNWSQLLGRLQIQLGQSMWFLFIDFVFIISSDSSRGPCRYQCSSYLFIDFILLTGGRRAYIFALDFMIWVGRAWEKKNKVVCKLNPVVSLVKRTWSHYLWYFCVGCWFGPVITSAPHFFSSISFS